MIDFISKTILKLVNPNYLNALILVQKYNTYNEKQLLKIQKYKINTILTHCIESVPFYENIKTPEISCFPVIDKNIMINSGRSAVANNLKHRRKDNSTSGTTGKTFNFYSDSGTDVMRHAFAHLGEQWAGARLSERVLFIWGAERDIKNSLVSSLINSSLLFNSKFISSFYFSEKDIDSYVLPEVNKFDPKVIIGYPSTLEVLGRYIAKNNNTINSISLKSVICSGEQLTPEQREVIEGSLNVKVFNRYGCRDVGPIAHECEFQHGLHVFSPHVYVEILDENGAHCKPGEVGDVVVTDLDNFAMPFIRYKIGDRASWSSRKCPCGSSFPLLENVFGRSFDIIIGVNGNKVSGTFFSLLRYKVSGIRKIQIIQNFENEICVNIETESSYNQKEEIILINALKEKLGENMKVKIKIVDKIANSATGKFRWIISNLKHE